MATETVHDPVCHMDIRPADAVGTSEHEGQAYYFCSPGCKRDFDEDPAAVLKAEAEHDHSQPSEHMMGGATAARPWWQFWRR